MKVRVSMPGATAVVELEENKAGKVFKELAGQLLSFGFGGAPNRRIGFQRNQ